MIQLASTKNAGNDDPQTSILGVELVCDKEGTKRILADAGVPVPKGIINHLDELSKRKQSAAILSCSSL